MSRTEPPRGGMTDEMTPRSPAEGRSLDRVQRTLASILIVFVMGIISVALALFLFLTDDLPQSDRIGLWIMTGVIGLVSAGMILMINRRKPYHPMVLLGLVPMASVSYWIF